MSPAEEAEHVRRAAGGDLAAFDVLVRAHEAPLRRYLRRLAGSEGDDLAQETLLAAWRAMGQWRGEGSVAGWLRTIATRRFLDSRRSGHVQKVPLEPHHHPSIAATGAERLMIDRALASLPDRERAVALLLFAEGHSHGEAAAILGLPLGTLKTVAARARAALLPLLDGVSR